MSTINDSIRESRDYWENSLQESQANLKYLEERFNNSKMETAKQAWQGLIELEKRNIKKAQSELKKILEGRYGE